MRLLLGTWTRNHHAIMVALMIYLDHDNYPLFQKLQQLFTRVHEGVQIETLTSHPFR